jgi:hypothetical protein
LKRQRMAMMSSDAKPFATLIITKPIVPRSRLGFQL